MVLLTSQIFQRSRSNLKVWNKHRLYTDSKYVVQSLQVYNNKLFVISNNSHKINVFEITEQGLLLPGIEIDTNGSSPREMTVIDNKLYFTNWNTKDIKILNLFNYKLEESIKVAGLPEAIINDGENIYVGIMMNEDYSDASTVLKLSPNSNQIISQYEVGKGPTSLLKHDGDIYVARTYYDSNWNSFYGTSKLIQIILKKLLRSTMVMV